MAETALVIRLPGDARIVPLGIAGKVHLKVERQNSGGTLTAYEFTMPPAMAGPPLHIHNIWDEMFYILEG